MAFLDDAVIYRILRNVPDRVFVLIKSDLSCYYAQAEILGVYFNFKDASLDALLDLFWPKTPLGLREPSLMQLYHPHYRFVRRDTTFTREWDDAYTISPRFTYIIQEWSPNTSPHQRLSQKKLDVLDWLRHKIARERPSCETVRLWTGQWQQALQESLIPLELADRWQSDAGQYSKQITGDRQEWVDKYGSRKYAFGEQILPHPQYA